MEVSKRTRECSQLDTDISQKHVKRTKVLRELPIAGLCTPPTTPEKDDRVVDVAGPTPRKLFEVVQTPYARAVSLFSRGATPISGVLAGREREGAFIQDVLETCLQTRTGQSLYVSGPPGTGKTAQVTALVASAAVAGAENRAPASNVVQHPSGTRFRVLTINCMTTTTPQDLLNKLYARVTGETRRHVTCSEISSLIQRDTSCDYTIVVLDEMDNIVNSAQQELYELFACATPQSGCPLLLVGIANALDLTDRFLPRLRANCIEPQVVRFLPYTAEQIATVVERKLQGMNDVASDNVSVGSLPPPLAQPSAITFCAKKAAVNTGDLRKAFDIMASALVLAEEAALKTRTAHILNSQPLSLLPKVTIAHVVKVCTKAFTVDYCARVRVLNLQQKVVLGVLIKFQESLQGRPTLETCSLGAFFAFYTNILRSMDNLPMLRRGEFHEVVTALETHTLVSLTFVNKTASGSFKARSHQRLALDFGSFAVSCNVPRPDFAAAVADIDVLTKLS